MWISRRSRQCGRLCHAGGVCSQSAHFAPRCARGGSAARHQTLVGTVARSGPDGGPRFLGLRLFLCHSGLLSTTTTTTTRGRETLAVRDGPVRGLCGTGILGRGTAPGLPQNVGATRNRHERHAGTHRILSQGRTPKNRAPAGAGMASGLWSGSSVGGHHHGNLRILLSISGEIVNQDFRHGY